MRGSQIMVPLGLVGASLGALCGCGADHSPVGTSVRPTTAAASQSGECRAAASRTPSSALTIGDRDSGAAFCVRPGDHLAVYLRGTPTDLWSPIHLDGDALSYTANGHLTLMRGVTGAAFVARRPGTAHVTSFRQPCPSGGGCDAAHRFRVTIVVR